MTQYILDNLSQSDEFKMSTVMNPVSLNTQTAFSKNGKSSKTSTLSRIIQRNNTGLNNFNRDNYGEYEQYKLNSLLGLQLIQDFQSEASRTLLPNSNPVVEVLRIDPDSLVVTLNQQFHELMKKYTAYDVTIVSVMGDQSVGKSFFCDKIMNLAEIRGNYFSRAKDIPGLYISEKPFIKDNVCIFIMEISGCGLKDTTFRVLNSLSLLISSQVILINSTADKQEKTISKFLQYNQRSLKAFTVPENSHSYFPTTLHNLYRNQNSFNKNSQIRHNFSQVHPHYLPDAKTPSYKGSDDDLKQVPFLTRDIINPAYIKAISQIFKHIYKLADLKKIIVDNQHELVQNGNIINKILAHSVSLLNSRKKIYLQTMYQSILRQLYVSAYNYCVMIYHDELGEQFDDEQPKSVETILDIFDACHEKTLLEFNNFNLSKSLYDEYEKKLEAHIDTKQELILQINRQKIQEKLNEHLKRNKSDEPQYQLELLQTYKTQLNDGRDNLIKDLLCRMYSNAGQNMNYKILNKIKQLNNDLEAKQKKLKETKRESALKKKETDAKKQEEDDYKAQIKRIEAQISRIQSDIEAKKNRMDGKTEKRSLQSLVDERQKLESKLKDQSNLLDKLKQQDINQVLSQLKGEKQKDIKVVIDKQKVIQSKLTSLKASQSNIKPTESKPKPIESKPKPKPANDKPKPKPK